MEQLCDLTKGGLAVTYHTRVRLISYVQWVAYIAFLAALLLVTRSVPG